MRLFADPAAALICNESIRSRQAPLVSHAHPERVHARSEVRRAWIALTTTSLQRWRSISKLDLDTTEHLVSVPSEGVAGSWRAKIVGGVFFVKMLHQQFWWKEASSVLRLLLLAGPHTLPDVDFIYMSSDNDPAPFGAPAPVLSNSHEAQRPSVPFCDFAWMGWDMHTLPWCDIVASQQQERDSSIPWALKRGVAFFSGNLRNGRARQQLVRLLNSVRAFAPISQPPPVVLHDSRHGGCSLRTICSYKYLLSLPGIGYASRLKQLLLCNSTVIHVAYRSSEWYMPLLLQNKLVVQVASIEQVIPTVLELQRDDDRALRVAAASKDFAKSYLHWGSVLTFTRVTLRAISERLDHEVVPPLQGDGYQRIETLEDVAALIGCEDEENCPCRGWDCPSMTACGAVVTAGNRRPKRSRHHAGYCDVTTAGNGDCLSSQKGAWALDHSETRTLETAVQACMQKCRMCSRCRFISVSRRFADCSWFSTCNLSRLHHTPTSFRTVALTGRRVLSHH